MDQTNKQLINESLSGRSPIYSTGSQWTVVPGEFHDDDRSDAPVAAASVPPGAHVQRAALGVAAVAGPPTLSGETRAS